jgi:thioredoxin-related protein
MRVLLIAALLISGVFAKSYKDFAKKMNYETSYEVALKKAKEQKKDIMFFMVANFCPWCVKFEKKVLAKKDVDMKVKQKFIPLIINREEKNFPEKFKTPVVPAVYFVDYKNENIKKTVVGYNNRDEFLSILNK